MGMRAEAIAAVVDLPDAGRQQTAAWLQARRGAAACDQRKSQRPDTGGQRP